MNTRLLLACVALSALLTACETMGGAGSSGTGTTGASMPSGTSSDSGSAPSTAGGSTGSSTSSGSASTSAGSAGTTSSGSSSARREDGSADPGVPPRTATERRADIDGKLDASLDRFDDQLRIEQQRTATERDSKAAARADGAVVDATSSRDGDKQKEAGRDEIQRDRTGDLQSAGAQQGTGSGAAAGEQQSGEAAEGSGSTKRQGGGGSSSKPIPSGVDDDIVARRLRRAAENETDPELKEKLWNEYRDYKENTQASKSK